MPEPWPNSKTLVFSEGGYARILPANLTSGKETEIESLGSDTEDFLEVLSSKSGYVGAVSSSKEYLETTLSTGVKLKIEKTAPTLNAQTGYKMSDESDNYEKFEFTVLLTMAQYAQLLSWYRSGKSLFVVRSIGRLVETRNIVGEEHILGKITEFDVTSKEECAEAKITITGGTQFTIKSGSTITYAEYNALMTGSGNTIIPTGCEEITPTDLVSDDFTSILAGNIVQKVAS